MPRAASSRQLQEAKKECNYLSMQIVDDPTKLKAELQGLQEVSPCSARHSRPVGGLSWFNCVTVASQMEKHEKATIKQLEAKVFPLAKQVEAVVNADAHVSARSWVSVASR